MTADYARQVAAECDGLAERLGSARRTQPGGPVVRALTRAADLLRAFGAPQPGPDKGMPPAHPDRIETAAEATHDEHRKRWHEAATQRDALVRAAREMLHNPHANVRLTLAEVVDQVESGDPVIPAAASKLRRELWHALGVPATTDDELIERVHTLVKDRDTAAPASPATESRVEVEVTGETYDGLTEQARATIDQLAPGAPYRFDLAAYPHVSTGDGRIVSWRADINATLYPQETQP